MSTYNFSLFADYFQFYIQDENSPGISGESWSREASDRCLAVEEAAIAVGTGRNMEVPVHIEFLDSAPGDDSESWDRINECSIVITSGRLVVAGCTDYFPDAARIDVSPGSYRARIYSGNHGERHPALRLHQPHRVPHRHPRPHCQPPSQTSRQA